MNLDLQPEKVAFDLKLSQSKPIYNAYKAIRGSPDWDSLSDARKRIVESTSLNSALFDLANTYIVVLAVVSVTYNECLVDPYVLFFGFYA